MLNNSSLDFKIVSLNKKKHRLFILIIFLAKINIYGTITGLCHGN